MRTSVAFLGLALAMSAFGGDVMGKWNLTADDGGGGIRLQMIITADGGKIAGTISDLMGPRPIEAAQFKDGVLTCQWSYAGMPVSLKLTVDGDKITGNYETDNGDKGQIQGVREVAAAERTSSATVAGSWDLIMTRPDDSRLNMGLTLERKNGQWAGRIVVPEYDLDYPLAEIRVEGENVSFEVPVDAGNYKIAGKAVGTKFEGTCVVPGRIAPNKVVGTRRAGGTA